jgi:hypothetical protein
VESFKTEESTDDQDSILHTISWVKYVTHQLCEVHSAMWLRQSKMDLCFSLNTHALQPEKIFLVENFWAEN